MGKLACEQDDSPGTAEMPVPREGLLLALVIPVFHCKIWMFAARSRDLG